jgi:hypothetical protein
MFNQFLKSCNHILMFRLGGRAMGVRDKILILDTFWSLLYWVSAIVCFISSIFYRARGYIDDWAFSLATISVLTIVISLKERVRVHRSAVRIRNKRRP